MIRCDFAAVAAVILKHYRPDIPNTQMEFISNLFQSALTHIKSNEYRLEKASVSKWLGGSLRVSPKITGYYKTEEKRSEMAEDIEEVVLPCVDDPGNLVQELYDLMILDPEISENTKQRLSRGFPWKTSAEKAAFIKSLVFYGLDRNFIRRDVRASELLAADALAPLVSRYINGAEVPLPCRHFCGRSTELKRLYSLLTENKKVFIRGIPGIGKSELAKAYAEEYRRHYANVLYLPYSGNLKADITEQSFADDRSTDTETDRFRKHNRFLRSLKEDTLIIIDNFDVLSTGDSFLPVIMKYRCHVLFTTRSSFSEYCTLELGEIEDREVLFHLVSCFYPDAEAARLVIEEILDVIHFHTLCTELMARLLAKGLLLPQEVLERLKREHAAFSGSDKITVTKDDRPLQATYRDHLHTLFSLFQLTGVQMDILRSLSLMPPSGIPARLFGKWMAFQDLNDLNDLIELGLVREDSNFTVSLHPLVREVIISDLKPGICSCRVLLKSIRSECLQHGVFLPYHNLLFQVIESTISTACKDDPAYYLQLLGDAFAYMDVYSYVAGMRRILHEMEILIETELSDAQNRALLLLYQARMTYLGRNTKTACVLLLDGIRLLPEITVQNAALAANLHATLGDLEREKRDFPSAKQHMETAASIYHRFGLDRTHDCVVLEINYATLLRETGLPYAGLQYLLKIEQALAQQNLYEVDYASVEENLIYTYLSLNNPSAARHHYEKLLQLYEVFYENEPVALEEKKEELKKAFQQYLLLTGQTPSSTSSH